MVKQITHSTVNAQTLPSYTQARDIMAKFWDQYVKPVKYPYNREKSYNIATFADFWANSTPTSGVRDFRIRIWSAENQESVDQIMGQFLAFVESQLPAGSYKVYSHNNPWYVSSKPKLKRNCAKVYYRSTQR